MECPPLKSWGTSPCNPRPAGPPLKVSSKIGKVTLYSDRALVTRTATVGTELDAGEHTLLVEGLPRCMEKHSVQVRMECPSATLLGIRFQEQFVDCSAAKDSALERLKQEAEEMQDAIKLCKHKLELISALGKSVASASGEKAFDKKAWCEFLEDHQNQVRDATREQHALESKLEILRRKVVLIEAERGCQWRAAGGAPFAAGTPSYLERRQALISINLSERAQLHLSLAYIVPTVTWQPVYDLRADTSRGVLALTYSAVVRQLSTEDWADVELKLSTSQLQVGGAHPELGQWRLNTGPQHNLQATPLAFYNARTPTPMYDTREQLPTQSYYSALQPPATAAPLCPPDEREVDSLGLSSAATAMFAVPGLHTVRADGQAVRVGLHQLQLNATFLYSAVPRLVGRAFLKGEVVNPSEYPLLPGQGSVFVDDNFVATIAVPAVAPSEKFTVFLGADEGISVSCTSPKRVTGMEGGLLSLTSKRTKVVMEYAIRVKNNKKTPVNIVIRDQIPVSENTQIVVELLEPNLRADPAGVKLDARGIVEWVLSPLAPGQKAVLKLKFSVEHPSEMTVPGI